MVEEQGLSIRGSRALLLSANSVQFFLKKNPQISLHGKVRFCFYRKYKTARFCTNVLVQILFNYFIWTLINIGMFTSSERTWRKLARCTGVCFCLSFNIEFVRFHHSSLACFPHCLFFPPPFPQYQSTPLHLKALPSTLLHPNPLPTPPALIKASSSFELMLSTAAKNH